MRALPGRVVSVVATAPFSLQDAARHWRCGQKRAERFLTGKDGFVAKGFVKFEGDGFVVTPLGIEWSELMEQLAEEIAAK